MSISQNCILNIRERPIFLNNRCALCWDQARHFCTDCLLVAYCSPSHAARHLATHRTLCLAIQRIAAKTDGYLYNHVVDKTGEAWRQLRIQKMNDVQMVLNRPLESSERELLLFPKICSCYETHPEKLQCCSKCEQVWFCRGQKKHLQPNHSRWCVKLKLLATIAKRNASGVAIKPSMDTHICTPGHPAATSIEKCMKHSLNSSRKSRYDDCEKAFLSVVASGPLTAWHSVRVAQVNPTDDILCVHLVGAEPHFELAAIDAWEMFFLHLMPTINHLKVVMVGPELRSTEFALHLLQSKRMCTSCKQQGRQISFEFDDRLYHDFKKTKKFESCLPDIVCAFNPGLHRTTGFQMHDTWPATIQAILQTRNRCNATVPFAITAYTNHEAPRDLLRIQEFGNVKIILAPTENPFASQKPDRNFISDDESPLIYKNYYLTVIKATETT